MAGRHGRFPTSSLGKDGGNPFLRDVRSLVVRGLVVRAEWFASDRLQDLPGKVAELPTRGGSR